MRLGNRRGFPQMQVEDEGSGWAENRFFDTIRNVDGGYSSGAERLSVAQDVVGSIPTSRPNLLIKFFFLYFSIEWRIPF